MNEEPAMTFVSCVKHDLNDDAEKCSDCHYELTVKQFKAQQDDAIKQGFYAGQAMGRVELEECHANWKKWNTTSKDNRS